MNEQSRIAAAEAAREPVKAQIVGLWRYPVASLRGEALEELSFGAAGVIGDRGYAILDADKGVLVGSSRPGWDALITWTARYLGLVAEGAPLPPVEISFPEGGSLRSDDPNCNAELSARLGKPARLVCNDGSAAAPRYALAPCHFLTTASLAAFREIYPEGAFDPARFRPNMLLDCGAAKGFLEQDWHGRHLLAAGSLGVAPAELTVTEDCVRCAMTVRAQGDLPKDPRILHTVNQFNRTLCGGYAAVSQPGRMKRGAALTVAA
ncbi:MAG TPA: MOSC N-terminal beta barrel domain-containing protein [Dongiaceae bacterium]|nr:MOSC N-terminal beta barrel domain-containing protein [Dongiaceae bacterium]